MSSPSTSSRLSEEASARAGKTIAGRRLANRSSSLRSASRPRSGFTANGRASYCGPPTAPNITVPIALAFSSVAGASGTPCTS